MWMQLQMNSHNQCWVIQLDVIVWCSGPVSLFLVTTAFQIIQWQVSQLLLYQYILYKTMWHIKHYFNLHRMFHDNEICRDAMCSGCSEDDLLAMVGAAVRRKKQQHAGKWHHTITRILLQLRHQHLLCALPVTVCTALISFLTPCSKVLLKKLTVTQLVKKLAASYGARRFVTPLLALDPVLSQMNPVHTLRSCVTVYYSPIYA